MLIGAKAYRTEWATFGEDEDVAVCIDLAVILPDGRLYLIDWKRSQKLRSQMYNDYKRVKTPLNHVEYCSGYTYALQFEVAGCALASLHPKHPFVTAVPHLKDEVKFIM